MESKGDGKSISVAQSLAAANKQGVFYAYLRTVRSESEDRYLLTFASAGVAEVWWSKISGNPEKYPGIQRTGAQFFSYDEKKPWPLVDDDDYKDLRGAMMYSQIADARERHGHHPIIPVQGIEISGAEGRQESESAGDGPHFTEPQSRLLDGILKRSRK
jgi:hypothetical protein